MIEKIHDIANNFIQYKNFEEITYYKELAAALNDFFINSSIVSYSIINTYNAVNSGVISVAFVDEDGTLRHENFPWWEEC